MRLQATAHPFPVSLSRGKEAGITIPEFVSAEIGNVNGYTVVTVWDSAMTDVPVVIITANSVAQTIVSSEIQIDTTIVHFVIPIPWHGAGDVLTINGNPVTNNIEWVGVLDQQADTLSLGVLSIFSDLSGLGHHFTQTGTPRPDVQDVGGYRAVVFDGVDDSMNGSDFLDNQESMSILTIAKYLSSSDNIIAKLDNNYKGWVVQQCGCTLYIQDTLGDNYIQFSNDDANKNVFKVRTCELVSLATGEAHIYINGDSTGEQDLSFGTVPEYSVPDVVKLATDGTTFANYQERCIMAFVPAPSAIDMRALEIRAGARYGITI